MKIFFVARKRKNEKEELSSFALTLLKMPGETII
jgi:hypothetical protein